MTQPVVQNQNDQVFANDASSRNLSHTVAAGTDKYLLVFVQWNSDGTPQSVSDVTWDSAGVNESLSHLVSVANGGTGDDAQASIWYLKNPSNGASKNITVNWSGTVGGPQSIVAYTLTGVDQTFPIRDYGSQAFNDGGSFDVEATLTTVADDFVAGAATMEMGVASDADWSNSGPTMTEVQNEGYTAGSPDSWFGAAYGFASGTSTLVNCTFDDNDHIAGVFIALASSGTGTGCTAGSGTARRTATNENVNTFGAAGQGRDYTSLATWESDTDINLVTAAQSEVLELYDDSATFDDGISVAGATTNSSYFRIMRPADGEGHDGTPNNGVHIQRASADTSVIDVDEDYFQAHNLIISQNRPASTTQTLALRSEDNGDYRKFVGIIVAFADNSPGTARGISLRGDEDMAILCLANDVEGYAIDAQPLSGSKCYFLNCVAANSGGIGFRVSGAGSAASIVAINCLSYNNTGEDFQDGDTEWDFTNSSHNASSDTTASNFTSGRASQTFTFVNAGNDDFHLSASDAGARNYGKDLSQWDLLPAGPFCFNDDIDGDVFTTWDIGFDEPEAVTNRNFESTANIVFSTSSDGNATREFASSATITHVTSSDIDQDPWGLADTFTLNTGTGQTGTVDDTWIDDETALCWDEVIGTPGFDGEFEFGLIPTRYDAVGEIISVYLVYSYNGNPAHLIKLQIWNDDLSQWDNVTTNSTDFPTTAGFSTVTTFLLGAGALWPGGNGTLNSYISSGRVLKLRFYHSSSGNITHDFCVEYLKLDAGHFHSTANITFTTTSDANAQREFASTANIVHSITSDINATREFASQADIVFATSSDINVENLFVSQADIVFDLASDGNAEREFASTANIVHSITSDINTEREFASQADVVFNTQSDIRTERQFASQADVVFAISADINATREFASQADIVFDATSDINAERQFSSQADIVFDITSDAEAERQFASAPSVVFDVNGGDIFTTRNFSSAPSIVFATTSHGQAERELASQADIIWATNTPTLRRNIWLTSQADIVWAISSDIQVIYDFDVTANVVFDLTSDIFYTAQFVSQADIVFATSSDLNNSALFVSQADIVFATNTPGHQQVRNFAVSPSIAFVTNTPAIFTERQFASAPSIVFDLTSDAEAERQFTSQADIVFDATSDANTEREFASTAGIVFATTSHGQAEREFASQADVVFDTNSDIRTEREFASQADIVFDISSDIEKTNQFVSLPNIFFDIQSAGGNAERNFSVNPTIVFDLTSDITHEHQYAAQADIVFDAQSDGNQTMVFASQADVVFDISEPFIDHGHFFEVNPAIVFDTSSDLEREWHLASQADIVFDTQSDGNQTFTSSDHIQTDIQSDANAERPFASQADIVFDLISHGQVEINFGTTTWAQMTFTFSVPKKPDIQTERHFASQADVVFDTESDIKRGYFFTSSPSIDFVTNNPALKQTQVFASQADIVWNINDLDHGIEVNFLIQPSIIWDINDPTIDNSRNFSSQADIVWDTGAPTIDHAHLFSCHPGITFTMRSLMRTNTEFIVRPDIFFETNNPTLESGGTPRFFQSQADIVFDTESLLIGATRLFASQADIVFDISDPELQKENRFAVQADIVFDIQTDINAEREFASQADIVWDISDPTFLTERSFASAPLIEFDTTSAGGNAEREFAAQADIVFATSSDAEAEREFSVIGGVVFSTQSDITTEREFASQADIVFNTESQINLERLFTSQADIVWDIDGGLLFQSRLFAVNPAIVFNTESLLRQVYNFASATLIEFEIPAFPVNMFSTHLFKCFPSITFDFESQINIERLFSVTVVSDNSDIGILWRTTNPELELTRIPVIRNFASTVNIIINVDSLNILNMSIDDLFPSTMRSITPKQTTTLIGIN
jgi:hypothetical protein